MLLENGQLAVEAPSSGNNQPTDDLFFPAITRMDRYRNDMLRGGPAKTELPVVTVAPVSGIKFDLDLFRAGSFKKVIFTAVENRNPPRFAIGFPQRPIAKESFQEGITVKFIQLPLFGLCK